MNSKDNLNQTEDIEEKISYDSDSDNKSFEINEITQDITKLLFYLNNYNNKLISSIKREYPSEIKYYKQYLNKYYCINSKWMNYFLELYNYKKIKTLFMNLKLNQKKNYIIKFKKKKFL